MPGDLQSRLTALKKRLARAELPSGHELGRPLTAKAVSDCEKRLGVELPKEYAGFLREVGDGGPAPDGVLLSLAQALGSERLRVDLPFPFGEEDARRILAERAVGRDAFLELKDTLGGVLPISDGGCGNGTYLVLCGPLCGSVWFGGEPGWLPHGREGRMLGFLDWYEALDLGDNEASGRPDNQATPRSKRRVTKDARPLFPKLDAYQVDLRDRGLTSLPDEVGGLTAAFGLYLAGNRITSLPEPLGDLGGTLGALDLSGNPIAELPERIFARLTRLSTLKIGGTQVSRLPEALTRMSALRELWMGDNPELDLEQALAICARTASLRWLGFGGAALREIPKGVLGLTQLERLYLNDSQLSELPEELASLKLEILAVANNRIERIPDRFAACIRTVYFGGNPGARAEKKRFDAVRKGFVMLG